MTREEKAEYMRKWRETNQDRVKEYRAQNKLRNAERMDKFRKEHPDVYKMWRIKYYINFLAKNGYEVIKKA